MKVPLEFVLLGVAILGIGYVASLPTTAATALATTEPAKNCTAMTFFKAVGCLYRLGEYMGKMYFLNINKPSSLESFHKSCMSLQECIRSISCEDAQSEGAKLANQIESHCGTLQYLFKGFSSCMEKFDKNNKNSKCLESWDPFVDSEKNGTQTEFCGKFFGENKCMKKEVTDTCSEAEWKGLRDHFIKVTPEVKVCGFENL
ncbi:hypothetical protein B9Z55_016845 [Caenorhabditis nigoni]|uniref:T20D4.11-like domain-containing protein n=1 Tax=Caenorhabditis nigoni TaxID=1611254 RepID=A0A2G5T738_9PELO|nr:hypothetical protein B9Z55_016845 [Caenorhabditis nigoni]